MSDQTFHLFPRLPPEIRALIWELCLPHRIIPLSKLVIAHRHRADPPGDRRGNNNMDTAKFLKRYLVPACLIAQVSRESRAVATLCRQPADKLGLPWFGRGHWVDPRTDTILLDCDVFGRYRALWHQLRRKLFGRGPPGSRQVQVALSREMAGWYETWSKAEQPPQGAEEGDDDGSSDGGNLEDPVPGMQQSTWAVVMERISLFVREGEARTVMFGRLGEDRWELVDMEVCGEGIPERLAEIRSKYPCRTRSAQQTVDEARNHWRRDHDNIIAMSRDVGFEGSEKEWRRDGGGPYPAVKVSFFQFEARRGA
ncbi:hypothetical protein C8A01DRAFT_46527 [Parachaetomium inaequale]|uniref:2EXR domain-containing protein n=1 Tax=Parachaetomium inaequale TaxID=2588326 RepID=A0AAN6SS55_9PEZI|nr:hypothetical protein C8A01DRAFT_46527 [Parachaetomium inaequale]